jgi:hypothetical protein
MRTSKLTFYQNNASDSWCVSHTELQSFIDRCIDFDRERAFFKTFLTILKYHVKVLNVIYKHDHVREMMKGQNSDEVCWTFTSVFLTTAILTCGRRQLFVKVSSEILTGMNRLS